MPEAKRHILERLRQLSSRERRIVLLRAAAAATLLVASGLLVAVVAASLNASRSLFGAAIVLWLGIGAWAWVVRPTLARWTGSGSLLGQARRVEGLLPELRGRLITMVESADDERVSPLMLELVAKRAWEGLSLVTASRVHPAGRAVRQQVTGSLLLLLVLLTSLLAPGGPAGVVAWWARGLPGAMADTMAEFVDRKDTAKVGDLILRYQYPAYTGLESKTVENSTGDVRGPPGTIVTVTARSANPIEAAGVVAYDQRRDAQLLDPRTLRGSFDIGAEPGVYRLVTYRGGEPKESRDFLIEPDTDLPPEVLLDAATDVLEVAVNEPMLLDWRARDDYGIDVVRAMVGDDPVKVLYRAEERRAEVFDAFNPTPAQLGLKAGDRVSFSIAAIDNNSVVGGSEGRSRAVEIVVLGAKAQQERLSQLRGELLDVLVPILADHLEEPWPPGDRSGEMASWGVELSARYRPVDALIADVEDTAQLEYRLLSKVVESGNALIRYTQVAFVPGSAQVPGDEAFVATAKLKETAVLRLEEAILAVDKQLKNEALAEMAEAAEQLDDLAKALEEALERDADAQELMARLEQLEDLLRELSEAAAKMEEGGLKEFVNQQSDQATSLMQEIRKAIAEGRMDDAKELMKRLAKQLQEMQQGVRDSFEQAQQANDDQMQAAQELRDEISQLEQEQRALQEESEKLRDQQDEQQQQKVEELWQELDKQAAAYESRMAQYQKGLQDAERQLFEQERANQASLDAEGLKRSIEARDHRGSQGKLFQAFRSWQYTYDAARTTERMVGKQPGPGAGQIFGGEAELDAIQRLLDEMDRQSQGSSQTAQQSQQIRQQQQQLQQRLEKAMEMAQEVTEQMDVQPDGMQKSLEQANQRMGDADNDLRDGRPMQAGGSQEAAADRLREAKESLEQAMQQTQAQRPRMRGQGEGEGEDQGQGERSGQDGSQNERVRMEIPSAEDFKTDEEYRRALLEGMEGDVPEEYRALKRRYYEELVRQ